MKRIFTIAIILILLLTACTQLISDEKMLQRAREIEEEDATSTQEPNATPTLTETPTATPKSTPEGVIVDSAFYEMYDYLNGKITDESFGLLKEIQTRQN